jgi:hypothetical protein
MFGTAFGSSRLRGEQTYSGDLQNVTMPIIVVVAETNGFVLDNAIGL